MKLAAIDIGSNSIHLIIADVYPDGHYVVVDKAKDMVGLASQTVSSGYLSQDAMQRGVEALARFRDLARERGVDAIVAAATSAVREAVNGEHFVERVYQECGIEVQIISGQEEARLIYLGARDHIDWGLRRALLVDIGGGSVEFILGDQSGATHFLSLPLGVRRLSEAFLTSDPPRKAELKRLRAFIEEELEPLRQMVQGQDFDFVVGSSGTLKNLSMMAARRNGEEVDATHGVWTRLLDLKEMGRALSGLRSSERLQYHGVNAKRVDTIVAGAQLIKYILRAVDRDCYVTSEYALRDGLIVDYIERQGQPSPEVTPSRMRKRSALALLNRFNIRGTHPREVARLTLSLFDQLSGVHKLARLDRERLRYAGLLYEIGSAINKVDRHRHAAYLIQHGVLPGFTQADRDYIARVICLRRQPELRHQEEYLRLPRAERAPLLAAAALLRLGAALDRSRSGNVESVTCQVSGDKLLLDLGVRADTGMERWAIEHRSDLFTEVFGLQVVPSFHKLEE